MKVELNGKQVDFDASVVLMDDSIRERMHRIDWDSEQEFIDAYAIEHLKRYGEIFDVS